MNLKLWIDDLRIPPSNWTWAKTSQEAIDILSRSTSIEIVSYDHDLGGDDTSRRVVLWQCENNVWPRVAQVHSANIVGREYLIGMIERYGNIPVRVVNWRQSVY